MKNIKQIGKLTLIRWLMVSAQLLLLGFVVHWLNLQYQERKHMLVKDIDEAWIASQQQMIDSIILKEYIEPVLDSSRNSEYCYNNGPDSLPKEMLPKGITAITIAAIGSGSIPPGKGNVMFSINDSTKYTKYTKGSVPVNMPRDLLLRSVKLIANKQNDTFGKEPHLPSAWFMTPDTALLKTVFLDRIIEINPSIKLIWKTDSVVNSNDKRQPINISMLIGSKNLTAEVQGYGVAIFKDIWTQMIFAIFLLLLTATAFIFSFRSLKTQTSLNNQRNDFIRNMSHELKTPVATVKVALEAIKKFNRRNDPVVMEEYLEMATAETNRLEMLISRVMSISSGNGEVLGPDKEVLDFRKLISDVIKSFKPRLEVENAIASLQLPDSEVNLRVDKLHMQGLLINLIDNCLKYCNPPVEIEISLVDEVDQIKVSVSDRGPGIPTEYHNRIFAKFFRVPTGDLHNVKGYGLGLSYAKLVVEQHGGKIRYSERPGGGSIFAFTIPVSKA